MLRGNASSQLCDVSGLQNHREKLAASFLRIRLLALVYLACSAAAVHAQTTWVTAGTGDFNTGANWSAGVPTSTTNASIANGTAANPTTVDLTGSGSVADLQIGADNTLLVALGASLYVYGTQIDNGGGINLNAGSGNNTYLKLVSSTTLSGDGVLTLNSGDNNGQAVILQQNGGVVLTNDVNSTIQGYGVIGNGGLGFVNKGTVNANSAGNTLTLNGSGGLTNSGFLQASGGGVLTIATGGVLDDTGGTILADTDSVVNISNTAINGGTLITTGTGILRNIGSTTLTGVTLTEGSTYTTGLGAFTGLSGTITNNGTFQLTAGSGNNAYLGLYADTTLTGGGTVTLNSGDNNGQAIIQQQTGGLTLTNVDNTIQGYGVIGSGGLAFVNQAIVNANASGNTLTLNGSGGVTNTNALLEATNGGRLVISTYVNNQGGTIASSGGPVNIAAGSTVYGGTLSGTGLGTTDWVILDGSAGGGPLTFAPESVWTAGRGTGTYLLGFIVNQGSMNFTAGSGNNAYLGLYADTTLTGGGTVTLNSGDNNGQAIIQQQTGGLTLTNVDNTIQGYGVIGNGGLTLVNQATINANSGGNTLTLNGSGGITNTGALLDATNGGTLVIGTAVSNKGGTIAAASGSAVNIIGGNAILGGTLDGAGFGTPNSAVLDGSTAAGALTLASDTVWTGGRGTGTYLNGSIINQGSMSFTAGSGNNTYLGLNGGATLSGGGIITLNSGDNNGQAIIQQQSGGLVLTNVDNTIQGYGVIGNGGLAFINQATVNANVSGNTLTLNGSGGLTNTDGLIEATGGGVLSIATTVNNLNGQIASNGGAVNVAGGTIEGGTISGTGLETTSSAVLDGSTQGALTLTSGSVWTGQIATTTCLSGSIINNGSMNFYAGSGNNTVVGLNANTALSGGGTFTLNSGDNNGQVYVQQQTGGLTLTNVDNTIQGYGVIGNGGLTFANQGMVNANVAGCTLTLNGSGGVINAGGLLVAANGGILSIAGTINNLDGQITSDGGWVNVVGGNSIEGGALSGTGLETTNSAVLDGSTQGPLTITSGSVWTGHVGTTTNLSGSIINNGSMNFYAGSGNNTVAGLNANTTLSGGGTFTLNSGDNNGRVYLQQQTGGLTLTNVDNTIQGYGVIGNGGLTLVNDPAGKILANVPGQALVINGSGGLTNNGTVQVNGGSTLQIAGDFLNTGTLVLGDASSAAGILSQTGNYTQGSTGLLLEMIDAGSNGMFTITGNVNLDGAINIDLLNGFTPATGQLFTLVDYSGSCYGAFSTIIGSYPGDWTLLYNPGQIELEFNGIQPIPEPSAWMDIVLMLPLILICPNIRGTAQSGWFRRASQWFGCAVAAMCSHR